MGQTADGRWLMAGCSPLPPMLQYQQEHRVGPGTILLAPKGVPHTYRVESAQGGRCLTITVRGDFERFVRAVSRPAERPELPEPTGPRSAEPIQVLRDAAAKYGIEFVGPPLQ